MKKLCFQHLFVHVAKNANKCMSFWYIFGFVTATFWWLKGFLGKCPAECQNKWTHLRDSCVDCRAFQALRRRVQSKRSNFWPQWNECRTSLWKKPTRCSRFFQKAFGARTWSERFKAQLSARTNLIQPSACGRRPLQNYLALPRYLTQSLWASLQGSEPEELRLEKLVRHAARLGLRCPTEPTFAMLLTLSFQGARTEQKQRQVLSEHKPRIKRWLNEPSPADYLEVLPEDVNLLPASLVAAAFGQDPRVDCPLDEKQLLGVAMQWPLRQRQSGGSMLAAPAIPTWEASTMGPFLSGIAAASAYAAHWGPAASGQRGLVTIGTPGVTLESVQSSAGSSGAMGSGTPVPRVVSGTPVATAEPEQLRAAGQEPIQQKPLLALEDRAGPPPQASHVDRAQEHSWKVVWPLWLHLLRGDSAANPACKKSLRARKHPSQF